MKKDTLKARAQSAKSARAINDMVRRPRGGGVTRVLFVCVEGGQAEEAGTQCHGQWLNATGSGCLGLWLWGESAHGCCFPVLLRVFRKEGSLLAGRRGMLPFTPAGPPRSLSACSKTHPHPHPPAHTHTHTHTYVPWRSGGGAGHQQRAGRL
jgi:hypothetical protein